MRLLLPPSEGKNPGGRGAPLFPNRFGDGALGERRQRLCAAVEAVARGPREAAIAAFVLPAGLADEAIATNARVSSARTRAALDRYAGVVYEGLAVATMTPAQRRVAARTVLVFSGLFGVVKGGEAVPNYRVPAAAVLPGIGPLGSFWRPALRTVLPDRLGRSGLILDLRSTDYAALWRPDPAQLARVVAVRVLSPTPSGGLAVISYVSKHAKGRLANALIARVAAGETVSSAADVAQMWTTTEGGAAEIIVRGGRARLDLVTAR